MGHNLGTMRKMVADLYDGITWKERVYRMPPNQIIAIYKNCEARGKFDKRKKEKAVNPFYQYTIFDYISEGEK